MMINSLAKSTIGIVSIASIIFHARITFAQNVTPANISQSDIENINIAKNITVRVITRGITVDSDNTPIASGVLLRKDEKTYFVLTNRHVVTDPLTYYAIIDVDYSDNSTLESPLTSPQELNVPENSPDNGNDVALLSFNSTQKYKAATLGDSGKLKNNTNIILSGYPNDPRNKGREFRFVRLKISDVTKKDLLIYRPSNKKDCKANKINEICNAVPGMSGGSLLNEQGELIGIHQGEASTESTDENKGIPLNTIKQIFAQIPKDPNPKGSMSAINLPQPQNCDNALFGDCTNISITARIIVNQNPTNQPFKKLFRPPVTAGF